MPDQWAALEGKVARAGGIVMAGIAAILCAAPCVGHPLSLAGGASDGGDLAQRLRGWQEPDRRVCAVDRLSESRLPRTICLTVQQWRERQYRGLSRQ
jgi:hypothetical protein